MSQRNTAPAVDVAVELLTKRLDELRALDKLEPDERTEVRALAALLSDIEAKQEHAAHAHKSLVLAALVGKRDLDKLAPFLREKALATLLGAQAKAIEGKVVTEKPPVRPDRKKRSAKVSPAE